LTAVTRRRADIQISFLSSFLPRFALFFIVTAACSSSSSGSSSSVLSYAATAATLLAHMQMCYTRFGAERERKKRKTWTKKRTQSGRARRPSGRERMQLLLLCCYSIYSRYWVSKCVCCAIRIFMDSYTGREYTRIFIVL
jgi:hypothetical protein